MLFTFPFGSLMGLPIGLSAGTADSRPSFGVEISIGGRKGMPMNTDGLVCSHCGRANSPKKVLAKRNGFKMSGIYTGSNTAKVVKYHSLWNRSSQPFITQTMSQILSLLYGKATISIRKAITYPKPTIISFLDSRPESILGV